MSSFKGAGKSRIEGMFGKIIRRQKTEKAIAVLKLAVDTFIEENISFLLSGHHRETGNKSCIIKKKDLERALRDAYNEYKMPYELCRMSGVRPHLTPWAIKQLKQTKKKRKRRAVIKKTV
jgi:hypothetical protein